MSGRGTALRVVGSSLMLLLGMAIPGHAEAAEGDRILSAMKQELERSRTLKVPSLEAPYFIEYTLDDAEAFSVSATLGGVVSTSNNKFRLPGVQVRVGDYQFDNTNYTRSGSPLSGDQFPIEDSLEVMRRFFWLATDRAYKSAVESIARKRAALKNVTLSENTPDFAKAEASRVVLASGSGRLDRDQWTARVRSLSQLFAAYPELLDSMVEFQGVRSTRYQVNTEGTEVRVPEVLAFLRAQASIQAADGMVLQDTVLFPALDFDRMPAEADLSRAVKLLAENMTRLAKAPLGEDYAGPVIFEGQAAGQFFAQVLGKNLVLFRKPVTDPGQPGSFPTSELEGRIGAKILPEWMDVVDDPTQKEWRGRPLFGQYEVDLEGVRPQPLPVVEKGVLKSFLLTRQPVKTFASSNGRARLPGVFGAKTAGFSNLFVRPAEVVPSEELKTKMVELLKSRGKPYGILIRKMDFPFGGSFDEIRRMLVRHAQAGASGKAASPPVLAYKVYADGREEMVRGLQFRALSARSMKDILAASDELHAFEFMDNGAPLSISGGGGYVAEACVVAPSVLVDDLELRRHDDELPKTPTVPAPTIVVSR